MSGVGLIDRFMRSSVDRALKMQPRRTQKMADEFLYASPSAKDDVAAIRAAGERLVSGGLCPPGMGAIAVRRSTGRATLTAVGSDLRAIDNRHLESVDLDDRISPALAALRAGAGAAIYAFPPTLLALVAEEGTLDSTVSDLAGIVGGLNVVTGVDDVRSGLTVIRGRGVVSGHDDPLAAVARIEAAETLATITNLRRTLRSNATESNFGATFETTEESHG